MADAIVLRRGATLYRTEATNDGAVRIDDGNPVAPAPRARAVVSGDARWVFLDGETYEFHVVRGSRRKTAGHAASLAAPMPATVLRLNVAAGDRVRRGDTLVVLEAMKMELPVRAPSDALVEAVHCREGEIVQPGVSLIDLGD